MSSERSGSNLLRTLLSNHTDLAGPMAAQFLNLFPDRLDVFEPLDEEEGAIALVEAMLAVANHQTFRWGLAIDAAQLVRDHGVRDFLGAFDALYRAWQAMDGARRYVCKENRLFDHAPALMERFPGTQVLYLVRDPRDYVLSWQKAPILNNTPHEAAVAWQREQQACLQIEARYPTAVKRLAYEQLVQDPAGCMTDVLEFLGESPQAACFEVQGEKNEGQAWSSFWKNLTQPVLSENFHKFRGAFPARTLEMIETVCLPSMRALGYRPETSHRWRPGPWFAARERRLAARNDARLRREHASTVRVIQERDAMLHGMIQARYKPELGQGRG
ncbi:MAG: sulfotransferase [Planctomycetes bacterium]|nr:sulfotransferase [Planctomycetota bacterium]